MQAVNGNTKDLDHIGILAVLTYVWSALSLLGIAFLGLHYTMMRFIFMNPNMEWESQGDAPPFAPEEFFSVFVWFYVFMGTIFLAGGLVNLISAICLQKKKGRMFSMVVAGLNCAQVPLGTGLGVSTLIVLMRPSVRDLYASC